MSYPNKLHPFGVILHNYNYVRRSRLKHYKFASHIYNCYFIFFFHFWPNEPYLRCFLDDQMFICLLWFCRISCTHRVQVDMLSEMQALHVGRELLSSDIGFHVNPLNGSRVLLFGQVDIPGEAFSGLLQLFFEGTSDSIS